MNARSCMALPSRRPGGRAARTTARSSPLRPAAAAQRARMADAVPRVGEHLDSRGEYLGPPEAGRLDALQRGRVRPPASGTPEADAALGGFDGAQSHYSSVGIRNLQQLPAGDSAMERPVTDRTLDMKSLAMRPGRNLRNVPRALMTLSLTAALWLTLAATAIARDGGEGTYGRRTTRSSPTSGSGSIVFFPLLVLTLSLIQALLTKRKEHLDTSSEAWQPPVPRSSGPTCPATSAAAHEGDWRSIHASGAVPTRGSPRERSASGSRARASCCPSRVARPRIFRGGGVPTSPPGEARRA